MNSAESPVLEMRKSIANMKKQKIGATEYGFMDKKAGFEGGKDDPDIGQDRWKG